jgi:hypothetical protein
MKLRKSKTCQLLVAVFLSALLILGGAAPSYAAYSGWVPTLEHPAPTAYLGRAYTRTQWMRCFNCRAMSIGGPKSFWLPVTSRKASSIENGSTSGV